MTERIIDFSEEPASLHIEYNQLIIETETMTTKVPVNEIACLIAGHPYVKYTNAVLSHLSSAGGLFIVCNKNRLPEGMLLPLDNNYIQAERFSAQASITKPQKKQIWKQIIKAKIDSQAQVLYFHYGDDNGLRNLKSKVLSGDKKNTEAYAARRYCIYSLEIISEERQMLILV